MADADAELEKRVTDGWTFLAERGEGSADPASPAALAWARGDIAHALFGLGRFSESLAVADGLAAYCAEADEELGDDWLAYALHVRSASLFRLGRRAESLAADAEIIVRFRDSSEPAARREAVIALGNRSRRLLDDPDLAAQGVAVSDELLELLADEPDDTVIALGAAVMEHIGLLRGTGPGVRPAATLLAEGVLANTGTLAHALVLRLPATVRRAPGLQRLTELSGALMPEPLARIRRRLEQGARLGAALTDRLAALDDPDARPLLARAELYTALCLAGIGHFSETLRRIDELQERRDPNVAAAFEHLAGEVDHTTSLLTRMTATGVLWARAEALAGDDPALARIAFMDSVAAKIPGADRWPVRWVVGFFQAPRG